MDIRHHRPDVARRVAIRVRPFEILAIGLRERRRVRLVHRVNLVRLGYAHLVLHKKERTDERIEFEERDAVAGREYEDRRRSVEHVSSRDLLRSRLADCFLRVGNAWIVAQNREDRAHTDARVEIRTSVERIKEHAILSAFVAAAQNARLVILLACEYRNRCPRTEASHERLVRDDVEFLLLFALHIHFAETPNRTRKPRAAHVVRDRFRRERNRANDPREIAARRGVPRLLQEDVALEAHQIVGEVVVWHNGLAQSAFAEGGRRAKSSRGSRRRGVAIIGAPTGVRADETPHIVCDIFGAPDSSGPEAPFTQISQEAP